MEGVEREVYFQDVKLQMDAKLWGEEYSRHNPPKKVMYNSDTTCAVQGVTLKNHKNIGCLSNTGLDPLKNQASIQCFAGWLMMAYI